MTTEPTELFNSAARPTSVPKEEGWAFLEAASKGDLAGVKAFVEKYGADGINITDRSFMPPDAPSWKGDGRDALHRALWEQHDDIVRYLVEKGADVNASDSYFATQLMVAHSPAMAAVLLDAGAKIEATDDEGGTALMFPTTAGMIRFLASRGANLEARDKHGKTALMRVAESHYSRRQGATMEGNIVALLDCGAEIDARDNKGRTALMLAASRAAYDEDSMNAVSFLLKKKANLYLADNDGKTAAELARAPLEPMEPGCMDVMRLAMEEPDEAMKQRIAKLVDRLAVQGHEKIDKACNEGTTHKVKVLHPLKLGPGKT